MPSADQCNEFVRSPRRCAIDLALLVALIVAVFPQCLNAISSRAGRLPAKVVLWMALFNTFQLALTLLLYTSAADIRCVLEGQLVGAQGASALIGYGQVAAQWIGSLLIVAAYAMGPAQACRNATVNPEYTPLLVDTQITTVQSDNPRPTTIIAVVATAAVVSLGIAIRYLIHPAYRAWPLDVSDLLWQVLFQILSIFTGLAQFWVLFARLLYTDIPSGLSVATLVMHIPILATVCLSLADHTWPMRIKEPLNLSSWYTSAGLVIAHYIVVVFGEMCVLLLVFTRNMSSA